MKCRICGKNLNKGEIYEECNDILKEKVSRKEVLTIKRKYSLKYELFRNIYLYVICILAGAMTEKASGMILSILFLILALGFILFWNKRISKATICKFYNTKVNFKCKFGIIDTKREILYKNLESINKEQTFWQKRFDLGDIYIYAKKGILYTTGIEIKNVPNFKETYEKVNELIVEKKNNI